MSQGQDPTRHTIFSVPPQENLGDFQREFWEYLLAHEGWKGEVANLIKGATERE
jgi:hypothetical protein